MNELIFLSHIIILVLTLLFALKLGKEALVGLICVLSVLMNLFVIKQINLFGLTVTATDALAVAVTLGLNLLQEYYGRAIAQKTIWISFFTSVVTIIMGYMHLLYMPALTDTSSEHFTAILSFMPRIVIASLFTYVVVMNFDAWLYARLKKKYDGNYLVARNYASISITQLLDTVMFSFLGLWGIVSSIGTIIAVSYTMKFITIILATPIIALAKKIVPRGQHRE